MTDRRPFLPVLILLSFGALPACDDDPVEPSGATSAASTSSTSSAGGATTSGSGTTTSQGSGGSAPICGDGTQDAPEACDDGNVESFDGCSDACATETLGWELAGPGPVDFATGTMVDYGAGLLLVVPRASGLEAWRFVGGAWQSIASPLAGSYPSATLAFDSAREVAVLHSDTKTFEFTGAAFTTIAPATQPPKRARPAMAYDAKNARVVLYGGLTGLTVYDDAWTYDGVTWAPLTTTGDPPARHGAAMTYDAAAERIVMFGGCQIPLCGATNGRLYDTWELDGSVWTKVSTPVTPASALENEMGFDPIRNLSLLFSTEDAALYEYDGATFATSSLPGAPGPAPVAAYSSTLHGFAVAGTTGLWVLGFR